MRKKILFLVIWMVLGMTIGIQAQNQIHQHIDFKWHHRPMTTEEGKQYISFENASCHSDYGNLPVYSQLFSTDIAGLTAVVQLKNEIYLPMNLEYLLTESDKNLISDTLLYTLTIIPELYASNAAFTLLPFRKNPSTGLLERLYQVDVTITFMDDPTRTKQTVAYDFPSESPLAKGDWYKIQVSATGIYKITGTDLKNMGMDIASADPRNLKVYGLRGSMLPEINPATPNTGLQELSIVVSGEDDGVLNENDYIIFYGESPHTWSYDSESQIFRHAFNIYSDNNYYFISASSTRGKRVQAINNTGLVENSSTTQSDYYMFHEQDLENAVKAGKIWFGEKFGMQNDYTFTVRVPNPITSEKYLLRTNVANFSEKAYSRFVYSVDGKKIMEEHIGQNKELIYRQLQQYFEAPSSENFSLKISFVKGSSTSEGWLDFFEIQARRHLTYTGSQTAFRDKKTIGAGNITKFTLQSASSQVMIWDVTDFSNVQKMQTSTEGNALSFKQTTDTLHEFIAFESSNCLTPTFIGKIKNQNLLGMRNVQSVIVTYPDFWDNAQQIANEHKNSLGLNTILVTTEQVYNEFSSGKQDIGAIRDFMRMFYLASESAKPLYLLLFGDASFDYKNKAGLSNFVPVWEYTNMKNSATLNNDFLYISDDFFGLLDEKEGGGNISCVGLMDIGVGRFPVKSTSEAAAVVKKRLNYTSKAPETLGDWRNMITFVADDPDDDGESTAYVESFENKHEPLIKSLNPSILINKIYADSYPMVSEAGGLMYPNATKAIISSANQGTLIMDYVGHGSNRRWSHERLLDNGDIQNWTNFNRLPFVLTETCSYTTFDDYTYESGGEKMFLLPTGGAIAMLTSVRSTSNGYNNNLMGNLYSAILPSQANNYQSLPLGKAVMTAKRNTSGNGSTGSNAQRYVLFGDPALTLAFPQGNIVCTEINGHNVETYADTLRALSVVTISGEIRNPDGSLRNDFNGQLYSTIFDKELKTHTLGQKKGPTTIVDYKTWENIIFKGNAKVKNGKFTYEFFVPKDIDYTYGLSRINFYAIDENTTTDVNGNFENFVVGGINSAYVLDTTAPVMKLYMNDTLFISGGYTNQHPVLLAYLFDESGINTTGSAIGHSITAILDGDAGNEMIINNYYETIDGDYKKGRVAYPLYNLAEGEHTLTVRAWDSYNNSVTRTIKFIVVSSTNFVVENMYNYPNPFSNTTYFVFDHNGAYETLDITIRIFDLSGRMIREIHQSAFASGYRQPIPWNGDTQSGALVAGGYYIYQTIVKTSTGATVKKSGKLVVAR